VFSENFYKKLRAKPKAFPLRGRWHAAGVTDEVLPAPAAYFFRPFLFHLIRQLSLTASPPGEAMPAFAQTKSLPLEGKVALRSNDG